MAYYDNVHTILNSLINQARGSAAVGNVDLSGLIAEAQSSYSSANYKDEFMGALLTMCSKFWNRWLETELKYPLMNVTENEYGGMIVKNNIEPFTALANTEWGTGANNYTPDYTAFATPTVEQLYFAKKAGWSEKMKLPDKILKTGFQNAAQFGAFVSAVLAAFGDAQIQHANKAQDAALLNYMAEKINDGTQIVNIRNLYNTQFSDTKTAAEFLTDQDCYQYAGMIIQKYMEYITKKDGTTLFNLAHKVRRSKPEDLLCFMLTDFVKGYNSYLLNGKSIFNTELSQLPGYYEVTEWQGSSATAYALPTFGETGQITVTTASGTAVTAEGVIGAFIDRNGLATAQLDYESATDRFNGDGVTFYTQRADGAYINDLSENSVIFTISD